MRTHHTDRRHALPRDPDESGEHPVLVSGSAIDRRLADGILAAVLFGLLLVSALAVVMAHNPHPTRPILSSNSKA